MFTFDYQLAISAILLKTSSRHNLYINQWFLHICGNFDSSIVIWILDNPQPVFTLVIIGEIIMDGCMHLFFNVVVQDVVALLDVISDKDT